MAQHSTPYGWAPPRSGIPPSPKPSDYDDVDAPVAGQPQQKRYRLPQAIAHRGYSAVAPENTMEAFRRAVDAGAHAIETDLRLSRDGVVVLMHDPSLQRTFGEKSKCHDHDWSYLSQLRTLRKPHEPMARLAELLEYLNEPGLEDTWAILDVKREDDPAQIMKSIAATMASVPAGKKPWSERLLVCCWDATFIKQALTHLPPETQISHVGWSTPYTRELLERVVTPSGANRLSISMFRLTLASPLRGPAFMRDVRRQRVPLLSWTVNGEAWMRWAVRNRLDGVITDDPALFLDVCGRMREEAEAEAEGEEKKMAERGVGRKELTVGEMLKASVQVMLIEAIHLVWLVVVLWKHGGLKNQIKKSLES